MNVLKFSVHMPRPRGKARPRVTARGTYTPAESKAAERAVASCAKAAMAGAKPMEGPLIAMVEAYFAVPASWSAKKRAAALAQTVLPTGRPDTDNLAKLALDACNGIVYGDDAQVVSLIAMKRYSESPGLRVAISTIEFGPPHALV